MTQIVEPEPGQTRPCAAPGRRPAEPHPPVYRGYGGATVPGDGTSVGTSSGFTLTVHPGTLDVTINATGPPGNA